MTWGQDFLTGFAGAQGLKDYAHASKTFRTNGYELAPRNKFLFHVYFNLNTTEIPTLSNVFSGSEQAELGLLVKTIQLPSYNLDTETLNQYNRKRIIQKRINYQPVTMTFHDDGGDLSRNLWYNYYSYYYKDPSQQYGSVSNQNGSIGAVQNEPGFTYGQRDIYANNRPVNDWGYIGEGYMQGAAGASGGPGGNQNTGKPAFFRDITIYGMDQHKWASYVLINPLVKEWKHDQYNYSEGGGTMENSMTVEYETVKYYAGAIGGSRPDTNVKGFADPAHYDNIRSSLARPGSTRSVLGQGGLLDAGIGIVQDLTTGKGLTGVIGAIQKAGTAYNTFKGQNIKSIVNEEANAALKSVVRNSLPGAIRQAQNSTGGFVFPRSPGSTGYGQG